MSGLSAIALAIEVATRKRDDLAKNVAKISRSLDFANDQMMQLKSYAGDTDGKWIGSQTRVLSVELIRHHYQFMARLQKAISLQTEVVDQMYEQLEAAKQTLLQAEFRMASLSQLLKKRQDAKLLLQGRLAQRHTDEFAAMLHAQKRAKSLSGETT